MEPIPQPIHPAQELTEPPSSNAVTVLVLGIISLLCSMGPLTGVPAWIMGAAEIRKVDAGQSPTSGRVLASVGMYLGIIATVITLLAIVVFALMFGLAWTSTG